MNKMKRVDELMTGDGLRMLNEIHSKPIYTNHLGGDIFEVTYFETDDEMQEGFEISKEHEVFGQFMTKDETIKYLQSADKLGIKVVSARRSNLQLEDSQPLYRVRWIDLNQSREVSPEELNTGPDTTENINEVAESDEKHTGYPLGKWPKMTDEELKHIDQPPTVLSREWKEHDPETERINKAMARMIYRKVRDLDIPAEPGAGDWKEWQEEHSDVLGEEDIRDSGDVMFAGIDAVRVPSGIPGERKYVPVGEIWKEGNVDPMMSREFLERYREPIVLGPDPIITPGAETYDDIMYPDKEDADKETEQCNKNVSHPADYYHYGRILERMDDTHRKKNSDYGDAAYKGYKKYGDYYFLVQLHNKLTRLESLTINNKSQQVKEESIDDTLLDMANYAVMHLESRHRND